MKLLKPLDNMICKTKKRLLRLYGMVKNQINNPAKTIWCGRYAETYFQLSRITSGGGAGAWYIVLFGHEFWIGNGRPTFLNKGRRKKRIPEVG